MVTLVGRAEFNLCLHKLTSETGIPWLELEDSTQDMSNSC